MSIDELWKALVCEEFRQQHGRFRIVHAIDADGVSLPYSRVPAGEDSRKLQSECHASANTGVVSLASRRTSTTRGWPAMDAMKGSSPSGPSAAANRSKSEICSSWPQMPMT